ncbi:MAG: maleylacetoacetate isomerase, partial [Bdellovibrionota bacterium]
LYSYFRSSASYRVRIALNVKNIAFDYRPVHLLNNGGEQHTDEYRKVNPSREVPTLVHNGKPLGQSVAIIDYLDHVKPEPRLFPEDHYERALVLQACEIVNSGVQPLHNLRVLDLLQKRFGTDQAARDAWAGHWIEYGLKSLETFLAPRAGSYCFGERITAADCFLMPHIANAERFKVSLDPYPTLSRLRTIASKTEAIVRASPDAQPDSPTAR